MAVDCSLLFLPFILRVMPLPHLHIPPVNCMHMQRACTGGLLQTMREQEWVTDGVHWMNGRVHIHIEELSIEVRAIHVHASYCVCVCCYSQLKQQ
jgi:hypothetical protein